MATAVALNINLAGRLHDDSGDAPPVSYLDWLNGAAAGAKVGGGEFLLAELGIVIEPADGAVLLLDPRTPHLTLPAKGGARLGYAICAKKRDAKALREVGKVVRDEVVRGEEAITAELRRDGDVTGLLVLAAASRAAAAARRAEAAEGGLPSVVKWS
jgi:hypothetical protein